jgi:hypothetical protein
MPLASLRRLAVQAVLSAPTRLARDRYANATLILSGALKLPARQRGDPGLVEKIAHRYSFGSCPGSPVGSGTAAALQLVHGRRSAAAPM